MNYYHKDYKIYKINTKLENISLIEYVCKNYYKNLFNRCMYPLTVQRFLKSSLSGYTDSGENLKVSTCITSTTDRCLNTYNRLKDKFFTLFV
jgi:hypothetical protein